MIQSFHDFDLPIDLLQITVVQLWFIDNFYGHLWRRKTMKKQIISNPNRCDQIYESWIHVCARAYDCIRIGTREWCHQLREHIKLNDFVRDFVVAMNLYTLAL